ncbi:BUD32 protein kinase [Kwoniella heveanensis CBS 569]|uniref:EKC/KEOPS complex subunit BUD32 n=1 Tax=Kwoniella heveanensis BCC8398 TaxID=1296120 RepID=A0A1B9GYI3_9TREE|nr:BUD32 protein kinase [Kwoniella heveanensis BCC8398]OCF40099.1 BUD32 protein kinase [Kwoniella heveanensis CBS 569]
MSTAALDPNDAGPSSSVYQTISRGLIEQGTLIKQGAEAKVYSLASLLPKPAVYYPPSSSSSSVSSSSTTATTANSTDAGVILKYRFPKKYRHPTLDSTLTASRLTFEARALARASKAGVVVPKVIWVDEKGGVLGLERVEGWSVREVLGGGAEGEVEIEDDEAEEELPVDVDVSEGKRRSVGEDNEGMKALRELGVTQEHLMRSIGTALARLHITTIIHGDLTTSNMMVRLTPGETEPFEIVMIDFGLSSTAQFPEHYAVDLYVLERAFASTHPQSEGLYAGVLEAYAKGLGEKRWKPIETKLKDVRRRGRKRDMTG